MYTAVLLILLYSAIYDIILHPVAVTNQGLYCGRYMALLMCHTHYTLTQPETSGLIVITLPNKN